MNYSLSILALSIVLLSGCIRDDPSVGQTGQSEMPSEPDRPDPLSPEVPIEPPPGRDMPPSPTPIDVQVTGLALKWEGVGGHRQLSDGQIYVEASALIGVEATLSVPASVSFPDAWSCQTGPAFIDYIVDDGEIRTTAQVAFTGCVQETNVTAVLLENVRLIELRDLDAGAYTVVSGTGGSDRAHELTFTVVADGQLPLDCDACDQCGDGAEACRRTCVGIAKAMDNQHALSWWDCMQEEVCEPDQARACLDRLSCNRDVIIAAHCDVLARCAMDGRGILDEAACRESPYYEPKVWSCLLPQRRAAVMECMYASTCADVEQCISNAACAGDVGCLGVMSTRLAVDCHGICAPYSTCVGGDLTGCYNRCDSAAFRLADQPRRDMEACARRQETQGECRDSYNCDPEDEDSDCTPSQAEHVLDYCIEQLSCENEELAIGFSDARTRCGAGFPAAISSQYEALVCLGEVIQSDMRHCLAESPCGALEQCINEATCGDDVGCLEFGAIRFTAQ